MNKMFSAKKELTNNQLLKLNIFVANGYEYILKSDSMIRDELKLLLQNYLKRKDYPITENTYVNKDLKLYGEECEVFLKTYSRMFSVDISNFDFNKYFSTNIEKNSRISLGDLERGIDLGVLNEDTINWHENEQNLPPKLSIKKIIFGFVLCVTIAIILCIIAYYI